jgi:hypothetical protein
MGDLDHLLTLLMVPGVGPARFRLLLPDYGLPRRILAGCRQLDQASLLSSLTEYLG